MKDVAVPRLISVLEGNEDEIIILALERIEELSKKNIEMTTPIKPYLNNLIDSKNKNIGNLAQNISKIFERAARNKEIAKNRKIMREKERDFLAGKINAEEYAKLRKEYLTLKG
jgi:ABC-type oligopeptide transport system ATPase subunit